MVNAMASRFMLLLIATLVAGPVTAANIDLATVPERRSVELTIYNSEDLTLVRETRTVSFKRGVNPLQFSWANTLIDPTSVELRFPTGPGLQVLDTTFPHNKPQQLYWNVASDADREATVEISYFTSGISWSADYLIIADPASRMLRLENFVRVRNGSGEDYENARVRLVVGTINLVEKIAELARVPVGRLTDLLEADQLAGLRQQAAKSMMAREAMPAAPEPARPKQIYKEGLSEYFIYTIEGTETVPDGWSKRLSSLSAVEVPYRVQYRYRPAEYGDPLVRVLLLRNDGDSKLGRTPLPDGTVQVLRRDPDGNLGYLARQTIPYIPVGDEIVLNLGPDPEVVFEPVTLRVFRDELWLRLRGANLYRRVDEPGLQVDVAGEVAGWNTHTVAARHIHNTRDRPIDVQLRLAFDGDVVFRSRLDAVLHDYRTVELNATVPPATETELRYELIEHEGYNRKQDRVELQDGEPRSGP